MESSLWLIPCLPLLGAIVCGLLHASIIKERGGRQESSGIGSGREKLVGIIATSAVAFSFVIAAIAFFALRSPEMHANPDGLVQRLFTWLPAVTGFPEVAVGFQLDAWAITLTLMVTGVSALIHLYAIGYMHGDPGYARFFAYLNLFVFSMLLLVTGSSLPVMFVGWEGVGLCSYLLIGFWYGAGEEKGFPADSGRKAFIVNRIGDFGFLLGMFMLAIHCGTFEFIGIRENIGSMEGGSPYLTGAALLLFLGACGKSAQIPLYVWLPDAMAGPTPVSALIHAATMVTAGVYMIGRLDVVFAISPTASAIVATVGALTALYAATMGLVAKDIKKVLAYSTISQLGYMFLGAGMGALAAAMFHVLTHAFFKALLFLGAGSVIHGCHDEQDITKMGGVAKYMKLTHLTFLVGALSLAGFPLFSGFFSKDEILWHAFQDHSGLGVLLYAIGALAALMTAFYTFRLMFLTFYGKPRFDVEHHPPHESPATMTAPLCILAVLAVAGGLFGIPGVLHPLKDFLEPSLAAGHHLRDLPGHTPWIAGLAWEVVFLVIGAAIAVAGIGLAWMVYRCGTMKNEDRIREAFPRTYRVLIEKYRVDEFYQHYVVRPLKGFSILSCVFDLVVIDGLVNGSARLAKAAGRGVSRLQSGETQTYAAWIGVGTIVGLILILVLGA